MPAGVCSVVKSKPRRVRRSISDTSLDVHGAVTVEKVWIGEEDVLPSDQLQDVTDALCLGQRKRHVWSLYTNLACTQQCLKCEKRILTRRAAYKCTVCKKLCHLKCAIKERSGIASRTRSQVRYDDQKGALHTPKHIDQNGFVNTNRKKQAVSEVPVCETTERNTDKRSIGELDSLDEFIMQTAFTVYSKEDICKGDSPTKEKDHNITVQEQAKQSFSNLKTNFVRRCRSFKKKVEKLKDKLNCDDCSKKEENVNVDFGIDVDQETVTAERDAWMCSPVRKRLKTRLRRGNHILADNGDDILEYKRKSCERKCHTYGLQLCHMNDRLDAVEKKITELEQSVPREVEEWRKLHKKVQNNDYTSNQADIMELAVDETVPKMVLHEERIPSSSSAATSDDIYRLPESTISSGYKDDYPSLPDKGDSDQKSPSTVLPRLQTDLKEELPSGVFTDQQTSTPVTNREISFRSATNKYRLSQITHKNITHFNLDTSGTELPKTCKDNMESEQNENENSISSPRHQALKTFLEKRKSLPESRKRNSETEEDSSTENKILSPNQLAVQKFLERRRSNPLSEVKENPQFTNSPRLCSAEETAGVHKSPHIISSTFSNGNGDHDPQFNVSPISFTLRNDLEASAISFTKILEESKNNERKQSGLSKNAFNMSALSYTFRNDSSMIHTNASEHIAGFSDNLPRIRQENDNVQINSPRLQLEMFQNRANTDVMERPTDNTTDGLSLTNVTDFTTEHQNSLTENKFVCPWSQISQVGHMSRDSQPLSDELLVQVKCGVKLKNRSLERKEVKEDTSLDNVSSDSELKLMYDKIVNRYRKHKASAYIDNERITVDETGDNGHSGFRVDPYSKQGSKYQELFRFCTQQPDVIVETCHKTSDLLQQNSGLNSSQMPLELETCFEKNADVKMPQDHSEIIPNTEKLKALEKGNQILINENEASDVNVDKNKNAIEVPFLKNSITQKKAETFPRTSKKTTNSNYFTSDGGCEKAASYAGSLEHDRRSVYTETGSLDRYGDAKYHFLHEKGMIKICSPRLEIISKSPVSKRKQQTVSNVNNHISEEDTDTVNSSSDVSGIVIDNELHLTDYKRRLDELAGATESKQKVKSLNSIAEPGQEITGNKADVMNSLNTELQARQDDLANDILENCLEMIDTNQAALDHVFDWINKDCNSNDDSLNEELESLTSGGNSAQCQTEDSVYYSFRGQSDEIRNILSKTELDQHEVPIEDQSENQIDPLRAHHDPNIDLPIAFLDDQKLIGHDTAVINGNQTEVSKILESGNVISNSSLKKAIDEAIRQKNRHLAKQLLDHACGLLVDQDKNNVIEAWPAYQLEDEWVPIFVVLTVNEPESTWSEFLDFNVYSRKYSNVDTEAEYVQDSEIVRNNALSLNDLETVKQVLDLAMINSYNNVTVVSISPCRSRKSGEEIHIETCIVFHCLVKGLIPFNDKPFPESIQGIPVDVREGYFIHGVYEVPFSKNQHDTDSSKEMSDINESESASDGSVRTSTEVGSGTDDNICMDQDKDVDGAIINSATEEVEMDYILGPGGDNPAIRTTQGDKNDGEKDIKRLPLQIGAAICGTTGSRIGTLGGFVILPNGQIGLITCAHVVGTETGSVVSLVRDKNQQAKRFACGQVLKSVLCTEGGETGVDAAVVTVSEDMSICAEWPSHTLEQLVDTGFDQETIPKSFNGRILTRAELPQYWNSNVVKLGCMTGLTRGKLYSPVTFVRKLPNKRTGESKLEFLGQLEILPSNKSTKFFDLGDSGSLVFMVLNEGELYCIGLAVGCTSYGSCIVTPIEHVFKELMLPLEFYCPNREDNLGQIK